MAEITMERVGKTYPDGTRAVKDVDLDVKDNSLMVLVGPSGCGKTTLLRMVAGLEDITDGSIRIGDRVVNEVAPKDRDIAMVFQNYALYPHMSVYDNMAYGLKLRRMDKGEIKRLVTDASNILGLNELLDKKPRQLSGGQRQRVAMGRAIVRQPKAFLMDEPLSNLDAKLRVQMRTEIARIQRRVEVTTIYVTHDQTEAMTMGDRVAVMRAGEVQQVDSPQELYDRPTNLFVAGFIGSPAMNLVETTLERTSNGYEIRFGSIRLHLDRSSLTERPALEKYDGQRLIVGIRPEDFEDAAIAREAAPEKRISVAIELREAMGSEVYAYFRVDASPVVTEEIKEIAQDTGDVAADDLERAAQDDSTSFVARLNAATDVREGRTAELVVNTNKLHFFDRDGRAIGNGTA